MKLDTQSLLPIVMLSLLAALTFWLDRTAQVDAERKDSKIRHDPDFIVDQFTVRKFKPTGELQFSLLAQKMLHYPDTDTTDVSLPLLTYFDHPQQLRISAKRAEVGKDGEVVTLIDDVSVVREAAHDNPQLVISTSNMTVYTDDEIARTEAPVTIRHGASLVKGVGMEINNLAQTIKLLGGIQGIIFPKQP